jgi:predicted dehydrogenase
MQPGGRIVKLAAIGCGKQGARHLEAFARLGEIDELAVFDLDQSRAEAAAGRFAARRYGRLDEVFADDAVAAIIIATPTPSHAPLIRRAIAARKHVLCEKPLGPAGDGLAAEAERAGVAARIGYLYRFAPAIAAARRIVAVGEQSALGKILSARFRIAGPGSHAAWKHRRAEGGGAGNELASHMIDLALWFFGPAEGWQIAIRERRDARRRIDGADVTADAEDRIVAPLKMRSGLAVAIEADFLAPRFSQALELRGENGVLHASIDPAAESFMRLDAPRAGHARGVHPLANPATDLYLLQARAFVATIADPAASEACTLGQAAAVSALIEALAAAPLREPHLVG